MLWADAARGLAIALVVLHHASRRSVVAGSADGWLAVTDLLETVRMPLLFLVAGLFAVPWVDGRRSWSALLRTKVLLLVWVYVLWLGLGFVVNSTLPGKDPPAPAELAWRLVLPGTGWFIVALAVMFVVARAVRRLPTPLVLAVTAAISTVFLAEWVRPGSQAWEGLGKYAVFFLAGVLLRAPVLRLAGHAPRWVPLAILPGWLGAYALLASAGLQEAPVVGFLLRLAGVAAGISVALLLQHHAGLRALGRGTLPVYMTHQLLIVPAVTALGAVAAFDTGPLHLGAPLLLTAVLLPVTYGVGVLAPRVGLGWLFETPRWLLRLTGAPAPPPPGRRRGSSGAPQRVG